MIFGYFTFCSGRHSDLYNRELTYGVSKFSALQRQQISEVITPNRCYLQQCHQNQKSHSSILKDFENVSIFVSKTLAEINNYKRAFGQEGGLTFSQLEPLPRHERPTIGSLNKIIQFARRRNPNVSKHGDEV